MAFIGHLLGYVYYSYDEYKKAYDKAVKNKELKDENGKIIKESFTI